MAELSFERLALLDISLIILSLIQGIGEFLPISSSAHLLVAEQFFKTSQGSLEINVLLHSGSLLALLLYFIKDIFSMITNVWQYDIKKIKKNHFKVNRDLAWIIVISSIPTVIVGFMVKKFFGSPSESLKVISISSIVFGFLLIVADINPLADTQITYKKGFLIGLAQCLAMIPGASCSGTCLTVARFLGFSRVQATKLVFLMAIPILLGALVLVVFDMPNFKILFTYQSLIIVLFSYFYIYTTVSQIDFSSLLFRARFSVDTDRLMLTGETQVLHS